MLKTNVYDMNGKQVGEVELSEAVFGIEPNESVVHDVIKNHLANCRQGTQSALTRAEVSGAARSPGSRRAPATPVRAAPAPRSGRTAASSLPRSPAITATRSTRRSAVWL